MGQHAAARVDLALLQKLRDKPVPAQGAESVGAAPKPMGVTTEALGKKIAKLPERQIGCTSVPQKLAE